MFGHSIETAREPIDLRRPPAQILLRHGARPAIRPLLAHTSKENDIPTRINHGGAKVNHHDDLQTDVTPRSGIVPRLFRLTSTGQHDALAHVGKSLHPHPRPESRMAVSSRLAFAFRRNASTLGLLAPPFDLDLVRATLVKSRPLLVLRSRPNCQRSIHGWVEFRRVVGFARDCRRHEHIPRQLSAHRARGNHQPLPGGVYVLPARHDRPAENVHEAGAVRKSGHGMRRRRLQTDAPARLRRAAVG